MLVQSHCIKTLTINPNLQNLKSILNLEGKFRWVSWWTVHQTNSIFSFHTSKQSHLLLPGRWGLRIWIRSVWRSRVQVCTALLTSVRVTLSVYHKASALLCLALYEHITVHHRQSLSHWVSYIKELLILDWFFLVLFDPATERAAIPGRGDYSTLMGDLAESCLLGDYVTLSGHVATALTCV